MDRDFIGFSFNGYHSKDLGIYRVSDGNRYNENLTGAFQDTTTQIPGGDGLYYFRTNYSNYPFNISVAFDDLDEESFRKLRQVFNGKAMGPLIFDERPYKAYSVKVQSPPQFKYICFDIDQNAEGDNTELVHNHMLLPDEGPYPTITRNIKRIYKGEGTINFVSYFPYASSIYKYLDLYIDEDYPTKSEWATASGMLNNVGTAPNNYDGTNASSIKVYNPGDVDTDCIIRVTPNSLAGKTLTLYRGNTLNDGTRKGSIVFLDNIVAKGQDNIIRINSRTNLIEGEYLPTGATKGILTGNLYNEYIHSGNFFKIPVCEDENDFYTISISSGQISSIEYNYLYY